jgi:hypothetical protein
MAEAPRQPPATPWRTFQQPPNSPQASGGGTSFVNILGGLAIAVGLGALGLHMLDLHAHKCERCGRCWKHFGAFNLNDESSHRCPDCGQTQWWKEGASHAHFDDSHYVPPHVAAPAYAAPAYAAQPALQQQQSPYAPQPQIAGYPKPSYTQPAIAQPAPSPYAAPYVSPYAAPYAPSSPSVPMLPAPASNALVATAPPYRRSPR